MNTLFATTVANAKPQDRDYKLPDGGGLYLLVEPNGAKLWRLNYCHLEKVGRSLSVHVRTSACRSCGTLTLSELVLE
jgi:hypothetical protein